jgi:hypothetical protein
MPLSTKIFYLLSTVFAVLEIYQISNRKKLFFSNHKPRGYAVFAVLKLLYFVWIPIGFFTGFWIYFIGLFALGVVKVLVLKYFGRVVVNSYDIINALVSVGLLSMIFYSAFLR